VFVNNMVEMNSWVFTP